MFPGLAVAGVLRARGHDVALWVTGRKEEHAALVNWDGPVVTVRARGFRSFLSVGAIGVSIGLLGALSSSIRIMRRRRPDALLAMGSYASMGPALAARLFGIPVVLHEANAIPGRAIRFLSRFADCVATGFEETREFIHHPHSIVTGIPLRESIEGARTDDRLGLLRDDWFTVLVVGGSRGAHTLNVVASSAVVRLRRKGLSVQAIHLAGSSDEDAIRDVYRRNGVPAAVFGFLDSIGQAYRRASFAVCRAGASTCAELLYYGVPALLVPYPLAIHRHQSANARALERALVADVVDEKELTEGRLEAYLLGKMNDPALPESERPAARRRGTRGASAALARLVEDAARKAT